MSNVEVHVAADLVGNVGAEVASNDAVPHALVLLLKAHLHVRGHKLLPSHTHMPLTFSELEVSSAFVASFTAKSRMSSSMKQSLIVGFPRLIFL